MAIKQLSVFVENKPGRLIPMIKALSDAQINIRAMSIADTQDFGILRLIVSDEKKAKEILSIYSIVTSIEVIAVKISDKAGALCGVLDALGDAGINIEYTYAFTASADFGAYAVMRVEDNAAAEKVLNEKGFATLENADISKI